MLPFGLNDKAVQKKLLPSSVVQEKNITKLEITFSEDGGGEDFEDVFVYWIGKEDFLIDYLAYSYHTNGGGKRFRVLKEQCNIKGIRFVDYHNYQTVDLRNPLIDLDLAFDKKQLKKVSEIILENIEVTLLKIKMSKNNSSVKTLNDFYNKASEETRLDSGWVFLNLNASSRLLKDILQNQATIVDVGGGTGKYSEWLANMGMMFI